MCNYELMMDNILAIETGELTKVFSDAGTSPLIEIIRPKTKRIPKGFRNCKRKWR